MTQAAGGLQKMLDHEEKIAAVKVSVGAGGVAAYNLTLNEWVALVTIAYLVLQIGLLLPKYWQILKEYRSK